MDEIGPLVRFDVNSRVVDIQENNRFTIKKICQLKLAIEILMVFWCGRQVVKPQNNEDVAYSNIFPQNIK